MRSVQVSTSSGGSQGATIIIEDFLKFQTEQGQFAAQHIKLYIRYLKRDFHSDDIAFGKEKADSIDLQAKSDSIAKEHGGVNVEGILPSSTHSRLVVLIHLGIGFVRILFLCIMTSSLPWIAQLLVVVLHISTCLAHVHVVQYRSAWPIKKRNEPASQAIRPTAEARLVPINIGVHMLYVRPKGPETTDFRRCL
jgi:hypothetical protein